MLICYWVELDDKKAASVFVFLNCAAEGFQQKLPCHLLAAFSTLSLAELVFFPPVWQAHVQLKSWMYDGVCQHHAAQQAASTEDIGTEISRLRQASALLYRVRKDSKNMSQDIQQSIKQTEDAVNTRLSRAEKV